MRPRFHQLTLALCLTASPVAAEELVDLEWFEDHVTGFTLHFQRDGQYHGAEQFLEDRRTIWQFSDGQCSAGGWFEDEGAMCFFYDHAPQDAQCWDMLRDDEGLKARVRGQTDPSQDLRLTWRSPIPLNCETPAEGA